MSDARSQALLIFQEKKKVSSFLKLNWDALKVSSLSYSPNVKLIPAKFFETALSFISV